MIISIFVVALVGFGISLYTYLLEEKIKRVPDYKPVCDISDRISCTKPMKSPYATLFYFSNAIVGMVFYALVALLALLEMHKLLIILIIAGDSVGGLLATTVALMVKERNGPSIKFQVLFSPVTDSTFDTPSYQEFATGYYLEKEALEWVWNLYAPDKKVREEPFVSPLKASVDQLRGLPPALIITSECDVLRDEGEAYAHKLMQANIPVVATRYLGMIHNFVMINALEHIPSVRLAIAQAVTALKNAFGK
jgi:hypothetical protein